jgi:hypothetical protein
MIGQREIPSKPHSKPAWDPQLKRELAEEAPARVMFPGFRLDEPIENVAYLQCARYV